MDEKISEIKKKYAEYAEQNGFKLNPNEKIVENIIKGLLGNEQKHGARYCPCRRVTGDKLKDAQIICPCAFHRDELEGDGHCFCRLFVK